MKYRNKFFSPSNSVMLLMVILSCMNVSVYGQLNFDPESIVQAGGSDISVLDYSVPSFRDWDNDSLNDLIIGEGSGSYSESKVKIFLNSGSQYSPQFNSYFYAQADGADLYAPGSG